MAKIKAIHKRECPQMESDWILVHAGRRGQRGYYVQHCILNGPEAIVTVSEPFFDVQTALGLAKNLALKHQVETIYIEREA